MINRFPPKTNKNQQKNRAEARTQKHATMTKSRRSHQRHQATPCPFYYTILMLIVKEIHGKHFIWIERDMSEKDPMATVSHFAATNQKTRALTPPLMLSCGCCLQLLPMSLSLN